MSPENDSPATETTSQEHDADRTTPADSGTSSNVPGSDDRNTTPSPPARKKRRPLLWLFLFTLMLCLGTALYAWHDARTFLNTPPSSPGESLIVDIEPGMTLAQVADMLEQKGVITSSSRFQLLTRYEEKSRNLQAGRFLVLKVIRKEELDLKRLAESQGISIDEAVKLRVEKSVEAAPLPSMCAVLVNFTLMFSSMYRRRS